MSDPKMVDAVELVSNEKEQKGAFSTLWCVTGTVRMQRRPADSGDPQMTERPFIFNVVAQQPVDAVRAYYGKVADLNQLSDIVAGVTISSITWCAKVDSV